MHSTGDPLVIDAWLSALRDPDFDGEVLLDGTPGRLRIPSRWVVARSFPGEHLFYFAAEGSFRVELEGSERRVDAGDLLWIPAGVAFHCWLPEGETVLLFRFRLRTRHTIPLAPECARSHLFADARSCRAWVEHLIDEASAAAGHRNARVRGLLLCLVTELARSRSSVAAERSSVFNRAQQTALQNYVAACGVNWPSPVDLASHLRLSPDYFTRVFTRTFGMPPRRWLVEQRIRYAALRLTESRLNISEVAHEFGYADLFLFSRQFKQVLGVSPSEYRHRQNA